MDENVNPLSDETVSDIQKMGWSALGENHPKRNHIYWIHPVVYLLSIVLSVLKPMYYFKNFISFFKLIEKKES